MFTGLVECLGRVALVTPADSARHITIEAPFSGSLTRGESVNVAGACQSVVESTEHSFTVVSIPETLNRTTLGSFTPGNRVNLERALRFSDRLGGHLVSGHVDCTGRIASIRQRQGEHVLFCSFPPDYSALLVDKGSVAIDGVSLTVVQATTAQFSVAIIPHTLEATTLGGCRVGNIVNLEFDMMAKYLLRFEEIKQQSRTGLAGTHGGPTGE